MKTTDHFSPSRCHVSYAICSTGRHEGGRVDGLVSGYRYAGWNSNRPDRGKHHLPHTNSRDIPRVNSYYFENAKHLR